MTGESSRRYASQNMFSDLLGPTADLFETGIRVAGSPFKKSGVTGSDIHALRTTIPVQNLIGLSLGFDAMEAGAANVFGLDVLLAGFRIDYLDIPDYAQYTPDADGHWHGAYGASTAGRSDPAKWG